MQRVLNKSLLVMLTCLLPLYADYAREVPELEKLKLGFDPSRLPPPERLSRHLFGSMTVSYLEDDVVISRGYGPLCGGPPWLGGAATLARWCRMC